MGTKVLAAGDEVDKQNRVKRRSDRLGWSFNDGVK